MKEFSRTAIKKVGATLAGKILKSIRVDDDHANDILIFGFTDGSELKIQYEWAYSYDLTPGAIEKLERSHHE